MAIKAQINNTWFQVGDVVRVYHKIKETGAKDKKKLRTQVFEGIVIKIKGHDTGKSFTVRRIGTQKIGIEMIFPLFNPNIEKIEVVQKGGRGIRRAKLYYLREKSKKETEKIYSRAKRKLDK